MTNEQRLIFDEIFNAVITDYGGFYFIYEHGGYGKTFIWNELSSAIWSREKIVLNVASNRIASLLIPGGRMVHSRFSIPIIITDKYTYNIKNGSLKAKLLIQNYRYFQSREILAPTFESVEKVNDFVLTIFSEMENEYLSSDTICEADGNEDIQQEWFILEFINDIKCSGLPNYKFTLKPGGCNATAKHRRYFKFMQ
ncbi:uncharacterized protein LOC107647578 [Arachis ipaensis]|uniref:uncharacterized protein LOC107647578 n=1 Tax=Arachis ipaensis TaxID=130454 RepID=UPI0007AF97FE|nr:uncharacterized protein LOC107647578 [Arachis ipaensis]